MAPDGYQFMDFVKVGTPLTVICARCGVADTVDLAGIIEMQGRLHTTMLYASSAVNMMLDQMAAAV